jgi:hypothetical protein
LEKEAMPSEPKLADNVQLCIIPYWRFFTNVVLFFDFFKEKPIMFRVFPKVLNQHQRTGRFQTSQKQQNQKNSRYSQTPPRTIDFHDLETPWFFTGSFQVL